ncbi:MAG: hypothetical protein IJM84_06820 [Bacteroidaceae bacterium]|nr:hypothetical protein [Bacteroidaceae bacterium]
METTFIDVLNQLKVVIPAMMAAELLLTSTIKGIFNITSDLANTILSWVLSLGTAFLFVLCNGLDFGLGGWNYAVAAVGGLIVAICVNKIYTWDKIKAMLDAITDLFGGNKRTKKIYITTEEAINQCKEKNSVIPSEFLSIFPNNFGINLCAVKGFDIETTSDNQYKTIRIDFLPTKEE